MSVDAAYGYLGMDEGLLTLEKLKIVKNLIACNFLNFLNFF
jgi:hypothetical protein